MPSYTTVCGSPEWVWLQVCGDAHACGRGHVRNIAVPLEGELQTNQRAELQAVIAVLRNLAP